MPQPSEPMPLPTVEAPQPRLRQTAGSKPFAAAPSVVRLPPQLPHSKASAAHPPAVRLRPQQPQPPQPELEQQPQQAPVRGGPT